MMMCYVLIYINIYIYIYIMYYNTCSIYHTLLLLMCHKDTDFDSYMPIDIKIKDVGTEKHIENSPRVSKTAF